MFMKGFTRNIRPLEFLTHEQVMATHSGTLDVLRQTGVKFESQRALKLLDEADCQVDFDTKRVKIPEYLVEKCLRMCPSSVFVKSRDSSRSLRIGGNTLYMASSCGMNTVDLDTWEKQTPTVEDQDDAVRVLDSLDNCHRLEYGPYHHMEGVHPLMALPVGFASRIRNSTKTTFTGSVERCEIWNIKMAQVTEQQTVGLLCATPPLAFSKDAIDAAFEYGKVGFPVNVDTGPVYGGTAPVTLAGATVSTNAELIAGIVLMQLIKPGTGIIASTFPHPMNMKDGIPIFGAVEKATQTAIFNQMWRHYGVPTRTSSEYSSGKVIDYQAGYEKTIQLLLMALSGSHVHCFAGGLYGEITYHPVMSVIDDDVAGMVGRILQGVEVTDETLAVDLIEEVGPVPGHFLNREHTRKWWKKHFLPRVADRLPYPVWVKEGKKSVLINAKERVKEIIATHEPTPLPRDQDKEIDKILKEAKAYYQERN